MSRVKISVTDWIVLWSGLGMSMALEELAFPGWWLPVMVVGHFFLFCNVFKVPRRLELVWAGVLLVVTGFWLWAGRFDGWPVLLTQLPCTLWVIGRARRGRRAQAAGADGG
jgi:hypothetical protein